MIWRTNQAGFTLPELLVTSGVLVVLVCLAAVLLHPHDYAAANRNAQRRLDMAVIMQAVRAYQTENGQLPPGVTAQPKLISSADGGVNLCAVLVPPYLNAMPRDPLLGNPATTTTCNKKGADYLTGFAIEASKDGQHVMLLGTLSEAGEQITVKY